MDLQHLLALLSRYRILFLAATVLSLIVSILAGAFLKDVYSASSLMIIGSQNAGTSSGLTYSDYTLNVNLATTYRVLCKTDAILQGVLNSTGLSLTPQQLDAKISVTSENGTGIIRITAMDTDPRTAALIANATAQVFAQKLPSLMQMDNVRIIENAAVPAVPSAPNRPAIVFLSWVGTLAFCAGLVTLREALDVTVKTDTQLEQLLQVPVLGRIPHIHSQK